MASPLSDLDELVMKCRDEKAKSYIKESVSCYKSGAFRSAIVSTWIAVSFDIIDKLKDLSLAGDKEAEKQLKEFEKARQTADISKSLKFERDILLIARDKLELISNIEFIDLERLQQDRNRCAHPSMTLDGEIFNPSAELARVHIRSAVEYLLQYPPAQGKYALNVLMSDVESEYFPIALDKVIIALENSPLFKARESLVRNFIVGLLKKILNGSDLYEEKDRVLSALNAIEQMHKEIYQSTLELKLSSLIKALDDTVLDRVFPILQKLTDSWEFLDLDVRQKLESYVELLPEDKLDLLEFLIYHKGLSLSANVRTKSITSDELIGNVFDHLPEPIGDRIVQLYLDSYSYEEANSVAAVVTFHASDFTKEQVEMLINGCKDVYKEEHACEQYYLINALRRNQYVIDDEIDALLSELGLTNRPKSQAVYI